MEGSKVKALRAAEEGDKKALQEVILEGKVGVADEDGNTPLMYAATNGREEIMRLLLDQGNPAGGSKVGRDGDGGKYIDVQNQYGWTALMQAACYGHSACVQLLLQRGADLHLNNSWKVSCLVIASQGGHFSVVHTLINHGARVDPDVSEELMSCTLTPLMAAAQCGHVEVVQELVMAGAHLDVKLKATQWTALMFAILNNRVGVVDLLLKSGAGLEEVDIEGRTPVDMAAQLGYHRVITLLTGGTLKNISDSEFFEAVSQGTVAKVNEMLTQKPNLANIEDKDGATPLMYASNKGHSAVCEVLLQAKAEVNTKDRKYGWTSLMHATHHRKYEVAEKLGQHGADVNIRDSSGSTAYDIASVIGDIKMIKLIANITVERLQDKTSGATPTNTSATPTVNKPSRPIDLNEFRSRLQHAYNIPTPKITIPAQSPDGPSGLPPNGPPRLPPNGVPSTRTASTPTSGSSSPSANLRPSLAAKGFPSPSKSAGPLPPAQRPPLPTSLFPSPEGPPGSSFPPGTSRQNSSPFPPTAPRGRSPFSPAVPGGRGPFSPATPGGRGPFSPATPGGRGPFSPATPGGRGLFSPTTPGGRGPFPSATPGGRSPFSPGRGSAAKSPFGAGKGIVPRKRANTEPVAPPTIPSGGRGMKRISVTGDLKSVLKQTSMERYFSIFLEQEVDDIKSFLSLASEDLVEMGITDDQDKMELMALIERLRNQSSTSSLTNSDVFY